MTPNDKPRDPAYYTRDETLDYQATLLAADYRSPDGRMYWFRCPICNRRLFKSYIEWRAVMHPMSWSITLTYCDMWRSRGHCSGGVRIIGMVPAALMDRLEREDAERKAKLRSAYDHPLRVGNIANRKHR